MTNVLVLYPSDTLNIELENSVRQICSVFPHKPSAFLVNGCSLHKIIFDLLRIDILRSVEKNLNIIIDFMKLSIEEGDLPLPKEKSSYRSWIKQHRKLHPKAFLHFLFHSVFLNSIPTKYTFRKRRFCSFLFPFGSTSKNDSNRRLHEEPKFQKARLRSQRGSRFSQEREDSGTESKAQKRAKTVRTRGTSQEVFGSRITLPSFLSMFFTLTRRM